MIKLLKTTAITVGLFAATQAAAETWTLDGERSVIAFGSVKKDTIGEAHTFRNLSGAVAADGTALVEIDLTSVQTNVDVRNERIGQYIFDGMPSAMLKANIDMDQMSHLNVGESMVIDLDGDLVFLGRELPVYLDVFVLRTGDDQVLVTTNSMVFITAEETGVDAGVDTLMQLANLPGITRSFPVTLRLMFDASA